MASTETLPEGTDSIIAGASATGLETDAAFTPELDDDAGPSEPETGGSVTRRLRDQAGERTAEWRDQAGDKARDYAMQGKERATAALDSVSRMIGDAAAQVDDKVGAEYGDYARRAQTAVDDIAGALRAKDVDQLFADAREFVRRSPGLAIGAAAVLGFALVRVIKAGLPEPEPQQTATKTRASSPKKAKKSAA